MIERGTLPHTILFHGPSGCGKTTLARIVTAKLKCHDLDFQELNSGSFRGIETIRHINQIMNLAPVGPVRVWLLDEVHKLTNDAQNAALKMLEDTPSHVYFLLCTTDPQKLIKPIITRCCQMPVRLLTYKELGTLATRVCKREKIELSEDVMDELLGSAQGSARMLLVLLEKITHLSDSQRIEAIAAGLAEENEAIELCRALMKKSDWKGIAGILRNLKGEPESTRHAVLGYANAILTKGKKDPNAYKVIDCFSAPFFNTHKAGLTAACYEVLFGE